MSQGLDHHRKALWLWILTTTITIIVPQGLRAQDKDSSDSSSAQAPEQALQTKRAASYFRDGLNKFQERRFEDAIVSFERAAEIVPSADIWYNIARCHEESDHYAQAIEYYQRYLRDRVDPPDKRQLTQHIKHLNELVESERKFVREKETQGNLVVHHLHPKQRMRINGKAVASEGETTTLSLKSEEHRLEVFRPDSIPFRAKVRVMSTLDAHAYVRDDPQTHYRYVVESRAPIWTWVSGSMAVATLATSIGLGVYASGQDDPERGRRWSRYSDYALGAALALGATTLVLYFVERSGIAESKSDKKQRKSASTSKSVKAF